MDCYVIIKRQINEIDNILNEIMMMHSYYYICDEEGNIILKYDFDDNYEYVFELLHQTREHLANELLKYI